VINMVHCSTPETCTIAALSTIIGAVIVTGPPEVIVVVAPQVIVVLAAQLMVIVPPTVSASELAIVVVREEPTVQL